MNGNLDQKSSMDHTQSQSLRELRRVAKELSQCSDLSEKVAFLKKLCRNQKNVSQIAPNYSDKEEIYFALVLQYLGQDHVLSHYNLTVLTRILTPVEQFYTSFGGIIGYQAMVLELLAQKKCEKAPNFSPVPMKNLEEDTADVCEDIWMALENMPLFSEWYPVGGAADRLGFFEEKSGRSLPAALFPFCGKTLLAHLFDDLFGREFLYYSLFGKQIDTPVCLMTAQEKANYVAIEKELVDHLFFGRKEERVQRICQPMVPTMDENGFWGVSGENKLILRPGGHGVIWKLAQNHNLFDWFADLKVSKALIRQINNPVAGVDYGLLAFMGEGIKGNYQFGFSSCPRVVGSNEGMNVVALNGGKKAMTNVEYCAFEKWGVKDIPEVEGGSFSKFSSNTNILFADLKSVKRAIEKEPVPGLIVNQKVIEGQKLLRLESMMQNIADEFAVDENSDFSTFVTYSKREKTIAAIKKQGDCNLLETPGAVLQVVQQNGLDVLENSCGFSVQKRGGESSPFLLTYHPALGPLYSIIGQKIHEGSVTQRSQINLQIADLYVRGLDVDGQLSIVAENVMGERDERGAITFSPHRGSCILRNVALHNRENASCRIVIEGNGELIVENVVFDGDLLIEVPNKRRVILTGNCGTIERSEESIDEKLPLYTYERTKENKVKITLCR